MGYRSNKYDNGLYKRWSALFHVVFVCVSLSLLAYSKRKSCQDGHGYGRRLSRNEGQN